MTTPIERLTAALNVPCEGVAINWCDNHVGWWPDKVGNCRMRDDLALVLAVVDAAPGVLREADRNTDAFNALRAALAAIEGSKP